MENNQYKNQTIALYKGLGWKSLFSKIRFWDAPLVDIESFIPKKGLVVELGCGDGIFSNFLAISSGQRKIIGIDIDKKRLKIADRKLSNTKYIFGDIRTTSVPKADAIVIFHVLHHLASYKEQEDVLKKCVKSLNKNGKIIIVEIHVTKSPKYLLGWIFDHLLVPVFFEGRLYSKIFYRKKGEWEKLLGKLGLSVKTQSLTPGNPISNIIIIAS